MIPSDRNDQDRAAQNRDLDRLLLGYLSPSANPLTPSSGFTQSVMDAVREQSTTPEPIPFPWKRFVPFALAVLCILAAFAITIFIFGPTHQPKEATTSSFLPGLFSTTAIRLSSIVSAIGLCLLTTFLSIRLAMGRE